MRYVVGTVTTSGVVTTALWLGYLSSVVMLVGILVLFGMWVWSDKERTQRFNSSRKDENGGTHSIPTRPRRSRCAPGPSPTIAQPRSGHSARTPDSSLDRPYQTVLFGP